MAFKKTQNRIRVQPTGLPDFSGYANAARQYENISDLAFGVGAKMREQKRSGEAAPAVERKRPKKEALRARDPWQ